VKSWLSWVTEHPFAATWILVSFICSIGGLMGIVEGWVRWHDFLANNFLDYYKALIRQPLAWAVNLVWPATWPTIPGWIFDVMVLWVVAANAAARFYYAAAAPHDVDMGRRMMMAAVFWPTYLARQLWYYYLDVQEKIALGGRNQKLSEYEEWVMYKTLARRKYGFRRAYRFLAAVGIALIAVLAVNYQLDLLHRPDDKVSSQAR
jgi:predicted anti-sigma-YlaC factor YlaD